MQSFFQPCQPKEKCTIYKSIRLGPFMVDLPYSNMVYNLEISQNHFYLLVLKPVPPYYTCADRPSFLMLYAHIYLDRQCLRLHVWCNNYYAIVRATHDQSTYLRLTVYLGVSPWEGNTHTEALQSYYCNHEPLWACTHDAICNQWIATKTTNKIIFTYT